MRSLSASKMNLLKECPRCFYDTNSGTAPRPRGIIASIMGGLDRALKRHYDNYRGSLPPELQSQLPGVLLDDMELMKKWRHWQSGLKYIDEELDVKLIGALDDCLVTPEGVYIPLDGKSKGGEPRDNGAKYYQLQLDCYSLLLSSNGYKTDNRGFLAYYYPKDFVPKEGEAFAMNKDSDLIFGVKVFELKTDPERAKATIKEAVEILNKHRPPANPNCDYCRYVGDAVKLYPISYTLSQGQQNKE